MAARARQVEVAMRIGAAAGQAGVNVQTLRYDERRGLLRLRNDKRRDGSLECPIIEALDGTDGAAA